MEASDIIVFFAINLDSEMRVRMALGLGMTTEEWLDLRGQVDDSFWVMRAIGLFILLVLRCTPR